MPELPEVETIVRALRDGGRGAPSVLRHKIISAWLIWPRSLQIPSPAEFSGRIHQQEILQVSRRGKFIIFQLPRDTFLLHLRMSGDVRVEDLQVDEKSFPRVHLHDRLVLGFENGKALFFNDARKFGRAWLVEHPEQVIGNLGPEPLEPGFTTEVLFERLQAVNRQVKALLLDQSFLAGMGNIYTDEALHLAKIHPNTRSSQIDYDQCRNLWSAIRSVLLSGIASHGASIDWVYKGGDFQNTFRVYRRTGLPCPVCGTLIERIVVGQRGTHFCPLCQVQV
jgi:formamidopyrimidine-DNA glycosylase